MTLLPNASTLIGNTPLVRLPHFAGGASVEICAKLESHNLTGSDKDRVVYALLEAGEANGTLRAGGTIVVATSGSLALSLAAIAVPRGYSVVVVMPEGLPPGRVRLLRAVGAEVILTPTPYGMKGANTRADAISRETPDAVRLDPFDNPVAIIAHHTTADELWNATQGNLAAVIVPVATAAMVSGVGQRLKVLSNDNVQIIAVQPASSPVLTGGASGSHRLLGMGAPFTPANFDPVVVDEIINVSDNDCHDTLIRLYRTEGITTGPAGGAALSAALRLAVRPAFANGRLVAILPDSMERYTELRFWETFTFVMPTLLEE
jgi:cysteine synthase A